VRDVFVVEIHHDTLLIPLAGLRRGDLQQLVPHLFGYCCVDTNSPQGGVVKEEDGQGGPRRHPQHSVDYGFEADSLAVHQLKTRQFDTFLPVDSTDLHAGVEDGVKDGIAHQEPQEEGPQVGDSAVVQTQPGYQHGVVDQVGNDQEDEATLFDRCDGFDFVVAGGEGLFELFESVEDETDEVDLEGDVDTEKRVDDDEDDPDAQSVFQALFENLNGELGDSPRNIAISKTVKIA
jgi:hypothetical protein